MKKEKSNLPLNYITLRTTKSRIDKGLLAVPVSLIDIFPEKANKIYLVDENNNMEVKNFTPYKSSSRECRIGGMKNFYEKYNVQDNDELIIQILDENKYRIIPENVFKSIFQKHLDNFENAKTENDLEEKLSLISEFSNLNKKEILENEFVRLSNMDIPSRKINKRENILTKENVSVSLRKILLELYLGKCQISGFTFIMKNGKPYFEIHHIDPTKGNHLKNLLVVSPNIHAQFTHCELEQIFDESGWLRKVKFNNENYVDVFQIIDSFPKIFEKEIHF